VNAAEFIASAAMRCMESELAGKRNCLAEIEAVQPETSSEYKLKEDTSNGLRTSIGKLEAHLQISRILVEALHKSAGKGSDQ
jgi:hypothetical protein